MPSATAAAPKIELPNKLLLVPFFPAGGPPQSPAPLRRLRCLHSQISLFHDHAMISGFIGYPHLLVLLGRIAGVRQKEIYFLGTAGAIDPAISGPECRQVESVSGSSLLRSFSRAESLPMRPLPAAGYAGVRAVSVDLPRRETRAWLRRQRRRGAGLVEMELFPLRALLGRPFAALLVASDRVAGDGIEPFDRQADVRRLFREAFGRLLEIIHEA